ncbi:FAD:protein FMN transferase [Streptacidiphilus carbonis]|uniref:FAD:protein FMN transferase n=1 Tax=Streptacidiphilus carbonis TaxID=105422 RepID=UPI000A06E6DA|nr:FAD:protein FMN transferase [Streptacidiphilus carbonis]
MSAATAAPAAPAAASASASADWRALGCAVRLVVTDPRRLDHCRHTLERWLAEVDAACSRFRDDSHLVGLNTAAAYADGHPVPVVPLLSEALAAALRAAELSDGDVDPTVGSAMAAIGYDRDFQLVEREGRPVRLLVRPVPGWRKVVLDPAAGTVAMPRGVRLDLGATAKAWAADRAAARLAADAGCGVLVSLGGDTAVAGEPPEDGWRIRVQDATGPVEAAVEGPHALVTIRDGGLASSGVSARRWHRGGRPIHHLVDPRTGLPAETPWRTVSVAAGSCLDANTASTAAMVRGATAPEWLTELSLPARLVAADGSVTTVADWPADAEVPQGVAA